MWRAAVCALLLFGCGCAWNKQCAGYIFEKDAEFMKKERDIGPPDKVTPPNPK